MTKWLPPLLAVGLIAAAFAQNGEYKPKRINKAIELLEQGQPIYYTGSHDGTEGSFESGKRDAQTFADYINYDMEHAPYDIKGLSEYMKGLAAGGPTKSGHRTPAVIAIVPVNGTDETTVRANAWMFQQVLATGVHGILLTHADTAGAVRAFVEAVRFPMHQQGVGKGIGEGRRGAHGSSTASRIWGISPQEYNQKADVWPLNPNGEILLGLKVEDKYALANAAEVLAVPGIAFAEGGPGDMSLSLNIANSDPKMAEVQGKIFEIAKRNKIFFMGIGQANAIERIKQGYMVGSGEKTAAAGRQFTKREMPW